MSTEKYLYALRSGDYLYFLEWPEYIAQHYLGKDCTQDADTTISLIVHEWITHGFFDDDIIHMSIIYSFVSEKYSILESTLSYYATALCAAAMQCMVFKKQAFEYPKNISGDVLFVIKQIENSVDPSVNNQQLILENNELLRLVDLNKEQYKKARAKMICILNINDYINFLSKMQAPKNQVNALCLGIARALLDYIREEPSIESLDVQENIQSYVNKIRKLRPNVAEEEKYLSQIAPIPANPSLILHTISWGLTWFLSEETAALLSPDKITDPKQNNVFLHKH